MEYLVYFCIVISLLKIDINENNLEKYSNYDGSVIFFNNRYKDFNFQLQ